MALSGLQSLWRNLSQRDRVERELDAELQATLHLLIDEKVAAGMDPASVARAVMREGALLTLMGVAVGVVAAYFGARLLRALLFGISETDAVTFAACVVFFTVLGAMAGILPARRAASIDPAITLRAE